MQLPLDCTRIIMHNAGDLNAIFDLHQEDMGLKVSSGVPLSERKDPEPSWAGTKSNHTTSGIATMPTNATAFKQVADVLLIEKDTLVTDASAATTKSNSEDKDVPVTEKPDVATSPLPVDGLAPLVPPIGSSNALSNTHNVATNITTPEKTVEDTTK